MNLPDDTHFAYIVSHEAWYARTPGIVDGRVVMVQAAADDGGVAWEFAVEEHDLGGPTLQVKMFADAFDAFAQIPEFFRALVDEGPEDLTALRAILDRLGAADLTDRRMRHEPPATLRERIIDGLSHMSVEGLRSKDERIADLVLGLISEDAAS